MSDGRIGPSARPGQPMVPDTRARVSFTFDGTTLEGVEGEPVAMSLWALGHCVLGWNEETGQPRSLYCTIGHCFECRMMIDGERDKRACLEPLREGLRVERQSLPPALAVIDGLTRL